MSQPRRIDLKTGFRCNNRCRFCVQGDKRVRLGDKSTEEIMALMAEARGEADEIVLTGGEVTIRDDLLALVAHARQLEFRVIQIQTNGRMLSHLPFARALLEAGATEVSPAIHGPSASVHDGLTRAPGSFRQTVKGVRHATDLGLPVIVNSVVCRDNFRLLPRTAELLVGLQVDQFQLAFVHPLGAAAESFGDVVPRLSDIAPYVSEALDIGLGAGVRCMTEAIPLCFLPGHVELAAEHIIPRTKIFDADRIIDDYTEFRLTEGKAKGEVCRHCRLEPQCEGPWREYPEHFGWDEFRPVD